MPNAIPRNRIKGKFVRSEAEVLEDLRLTFFDDIVAPVEEEPDMPEGVQLKIGIDEMNIDDEEGDNDE